MISKHRIEKDVQQGNIRVLSERKKECPQPQQPITWSRSQTGNS